MFIIVLGAIIVIFYEQYSDKKNIYIMAVAILIFMIGMMRLSANTPSKNQESSDDNVK